MNANGAALRISAVEKLEEAVRSSGWDVDYRQMSKGRFSTEHAFLDGGEISLTSVNFKSQLQILARGSPEGFVGFFLPRIASAEATMFGTNLTDGGLVFFPDGSEIDFVVSEGTGNETILVREDELCAVARALAPSETFSLPEATTIYQADPLRFAPARREISSMLRMGYLDAEAVSRLLAMFVLWMTDASPGFSAEPLRNGGAAYNARRVQDFIEENFQHKIRLEDLCAFTGVGARTLQRCFVSYFQVGVFEYLKVCRLNSVRRALVAADPSGDSITQIASVNGFSHLGRFSVEYRAYFGECPRETLAVRKLIVAARR